MRDIQTLQCLTVKGSRVCDCSSKVPKSEHMQASRRVWSTAQAFSCLSSWTSGTAGGAHHGGALPGNTNHPRRSHLSVSYISQMLCFNHYWTLSTHFLRSQSWTEDQVLFRSIYDPFYRLGRGIETFYLWQHRDSSSKFIHKVKRHCGGEWLFQRSN